MSSFGRDVAFAARTLRRNPAFAITAIATLASSRLTVASTSRTLAPDAPPESGS